MFPNYEDKPKTRYASFRLECLASAVHWESHRGIPSVLAVQTNHMPGPRCARTNHMRSWHGQTTKLSYYYNIDCRKMVNKWQTGSLTNNLFAVISSQSNNLHARCNGTFNVRPDTKNWATKYVIETRPQTIFTSWTTRTVSVPNNDTNSHICPSTTEKPQQFPFI